MTPAVAIRNGEAASRDCRGPRQYRIDHTVTLRLRQGVRPIVRQSTGSVDLIGEAEPVSLLRGQQVSVRVSMILGLLGRETNNELAKSRVRRPFPVVLKIPWVQARAGSSPLAPDLRTGEA